MMSTGEWGGRVQERRVDGLTSHALCRQPIHQGKVCIPTVCVVVALTSQDWHDAVTACVGIAAATFCTRSVRMAERVTEIH